MKTIFKLPFIKSVSVQNHVNFGVSLLLYNIFTILFPNVMNEHSITADRVKNASSCYCSQFCSYPSSPLANGTKV